MTPERVANDVHVGMGVTVRFVNDEYAATITRVSADARTVWFRQDRPVQRKRGLGEPAFLFVEGAGSEWEATLGDDGAYYWTMNGARLELGVRRWRCVA